MFTEGSDLRSERGGGTNFTTNGTQAHDLDFGGIELGRHLETYKDLESYYEIYA